MGDKKPDKGRRTFFDLLRNPEALGRELGRAVRSLNEALNEPTVPLAEYQKVRGQVAALEEEIEQLQGQQEQNQELLQQIALSVLELDKKASANQEILEKSLLPQDEEQLSRWQALRQRLWQTLITLGSGMAFSEALRDAWIEEQLYPLIKSLPERAQNEWNDLVDWLRQPASSEPPLQSPLKASTGQKQRKMRPRPRPKTRIDFDWIQIPAGEFLMGSDKRRDADADDDETPQQTVYLPDYQITRYPVTNAEYKQFVDATGHRAPDHWKDGQIPSGKEQHPVVEVSWRDAVAFCQWAGVQLPSEAQWEKAARGADGRIYPWGNQKPTPKLCNFGNNESGTTAVGSYSPQGDSPYGVADMAGNVWEWTSSLYKRYPYEAEDGREEAEADGWRVLRGGSFSHYDYDFSRCAARFSFNPNFRNNNVGFRSVVAPSPLKTEASG